MKLKCLRYFYFIFACLISSSQGQTADECVTCVLGDFLKSGWSGLESWFGNNLAPAAAGTLKFFDPNLGTNDSPLNFVKPETDPVEEKLNDLPGTGRNPDTPIETEVIANPTDDKNCDPNGAGVSNIQPSLTMLTYLTIAVSILGERTGHQLRCRFTSNNMARTVPLWGSDSNREDTDCVE